jgi:hypothetical protein
MKRSMAKALRLVLVGAAAVLGAGLLSPGLAVGQEEAKPDRKDPQADPGLNDPTLEDEIAGHRRAGKPPEPIPPAPPKPAQRAVPSVPDPAPGLAGLDPSLPGRRFYAEGTFLPPHSGTLVRARTGDLIFLPSRLNDGPAEPAMVLMECQRLSQLDGAAGAPGFSGSVMLSGQVFVYRDRHYLMPTVFSVRAAGREPAEGAKPEQTPPSPDMRAEDLIKELESRRGGPRAVDPAARPERAAADAQGNDETANEVKGLSTEGTVLILRRGRLIRRPGEEGRFAFSFDNGPGAAAPAPMTLLPCGELQQLEGLAATRGEELVYKISGRVTVYQGRNYLLPTMHQVVPPGEIVPLQ